MQKTTDPRVAVSRYARKTRWPEAVQISCVTRGEAGIEGIGGLHNRECWQLSLEAAIAGIERGKWRFYVALEGRSVPVIVATSESGRKHLRVDDDAGGVELFGALARCP